MTEHRHNWTYDFDGVVRCRGCRARGTMEQLLEQCDAIERAYREAGAPGRRDPDDPHTFALDHKGRP